MNNSPFKFKVGDIVCDVSVPRTGTIIEGPERLLRNRAYEYLVDFGPAWGQVPCDGYDLQKVQQTLFLCPCYQTDTPSEKCLECIIERYP